ncbi:hypothetical protein Clacol_010295 [Clathrus columnatus]|uniref:BHLH domain-containing protein n=1 Tax=Clathrus columnatus TaxID=1419009 RepID=A0AAV5ATC0_9AGAM|nr:hypothetical protein Clacol_010295 [Clathrus columnatus]
MSISVNIPSPSPQTPSSQTTSPTSTSSQSNLSNNANNNNNNNLTAINSSSSKAAPSENNPPTKRKANRRANTAERRATHNAVERQRRETLNSRFLDLAALLPNLATVRRPSKSAIVNSSIALIHSNRRARALAGRELRALDEEALALRREINEWRARARTNPAPGLPHLPPLQSPQRSPEFLALISEATNIDDKIVEEEERRAYLLAEGAANAPDGDYDPEDGDDVHGDWSASSPSDTMNVPIASVQSQTPAQSEWHTAAALQMQYVRQAQAQVAMQQAQAQALQQAQMQAQTMGVRVNNGIGNVNMNAALIAMGMPTNNNGNNNSIGSLGVGPLSMASVSMGQGQPPNAPTWSAHPAFSHSNPHTPIDSQSNPFAFTMSGNGMPDLSFQSQQQQYQSAMHQNFINGFHGHGIHHQRTPPSTSGSVSSAHEDDLIGSPRSIGSGRGSGSVGGKTGSDNASVASTPSPVVPGRQMNPIGNRNMNMNMNPGMAGNIGSMKTGWGLVGPHTTMTNSMMGMGGGGGMGVVPVAGMML